MREFLNGIWPSILAEVVPRELTWVVQGEFAQETAWYVRVDGRLDVVALLTAFQTFFREHSEHWVKRSRIEKPAPSCCYRRFCKGSSTAAGALNASMAWGACVPICSSSGPRAIGSANSSSSAKCFTTTWIRLSPRLEQTAEYMDRCDAEAGHLVVFDRRENRRWSDKVFRDRRASDSGVEIEVWGM